MMAIAIDVAMFHVYLKMGLVPKRFIVPSVHPVNFTPCLQSRPHLCAGVPPSQ